MIVFFFSQLPSILGERRCSTLCCHHLSMISIYTIIHHFGQKTLLLESYLWAQILQIYNVCYFRLSLILTIKMPYKESLQYVRNYDKYGPRKKLQNVEDNLLEYVLSKTPKGDPRAILQGINEFSSEFSMMHMGQQKGQILVHALKKAEPKTILQLGGYCGFSALLMAANTDAVVHSIEPNHHFASIAHQIHFHAGLTARIIIHVGTLQNFEQFVKDHGQFDFVLFDYEKELYLRDFKELERLGAIRQCTTVFGDNMISGSPDYHEFMKHNAYYDSTLYFSYHAYSNTPDAVLVSLRITQ